MGGLVGPVESDAVKSLKNLKEDYIVGPYEINVLIKALTEATVKVEVIEEHGGGTGSGSGSGSPFTTGGNGDDAWAWTGSRLFAVGDRKIKYNEGTRELENPGSLGIITDPDGGHSMLFDPKTIQCFSKGDGSGNDVYPDDIEINPLGDVILSDGLLATSVGDQCLAMIVDRNYIFSLSGSKASNICIGESALDAGRFEGVKGSIAIGNNSLSNCGDGSGLIAIGESTLDSLTSGTSAIAIGQGAARDATDSENIICIGANAGNSDSPYHLSDQRNKIVMGDNDITDAYIKVNWTVTSDERDKTDIRQSKLGLKFIKDLKPVRFKFDDRSRYEDGKPDGSKKDSKELIGFLAQDVMKVENKFRTKDLIVSRENPEHLAIKETSIIPILVKAIQELSEEIEKLKK